MRVRGIEVMVGDVWKAAWFDPVTVRATYLNLAWVTDHECDNPVTIEGLGIGVLLRRATDPAGVERDRERWEYADEGMFIPDHREAEPYGATYRRARVPAMCQNDTDGDGHCGMKTCPVCHPEYQPRPRVPAEPPAPRLEVEAWTIAREDTGTVLVVLPRCAGAHIPAVTGRGFDGRTCVGFAYDESSRDDYMHNPGASSKTPCRVVGGRLCVARWAIMVREVAP